MKINCGQSRPGFTIVEILVAIAIFAGVILVIYSSWEGIIKSRTIGEKAAVEAQRLRVARRTVEQALSSMVMFGENIPFYAFESDTGGDFAMMSFVARLPESFPGSGRFPGKPLRRVTFYVDKSRSGRNALMLAQNPILQLFDEEDEAHTIELSKDVSQFQLTFWDAAAEEWVDEWAATNEVPPLVRTSLGFGFERRGGRAQSSLVGEVSVAPPAMVIPREYQIPNNLQGMAGVNQLRGDRVNAVNPNLGQTAGNVRRPGLNNQSGYLGNRGAGGRFIDGSGLNLGGQGAGQGQAFGGRPSATAADPFSGFRRRAGYPPSLINGLRGNDDDEDR